MGNEPKGEEKSGRHDKEQRLPRPARWAGTQPSRSRISQWFLLRKRKVIGGQGQHRSSASSGNEPAGRHQTKDQFIEAGTEPRCCVLSEADLGLPSCSPPPNKQNHRDRGQGGPGWTGALILSPRQVRDWEGKLSADRQDSEVNRKSSGHAASRCHGQHNSILKEQEFSVRSLSPRPVHLPHHVPASHSETQH